MRSEGIERQRVCMQHKFTKQHMYAKIFTFLQHMY